MKHTAISKYLGSSKYKIEHVKIVSKTTACNILGFKRNIYDGT